MFFLLFFVFLNISSIFSSTEFIKVRENVNVTITCHFNQTKSQFIEKNFSEKIILWYKDETEVIGVNAISNNPKKYFLNQLHLQTYQLTIINVQLESSGLYKCQNFTAKEEKHFQLHVLVPPSRLHLIPSAKLPVTDGTLVVFNCTSERVYPNPIFEWYKNDQFLQRSIGNESDSLFFSSSSILTLFLTPADHNHILRCQVSNEASIDQTIVEVKLEILFKPIIKIFFDEKELMTKTLTIIEKTFETIQCKISANPSRITDIEWFRNDQLILGENKEQLGINFTGIEKLSCRAKNSIGETEATINVNTLYQPKLSMIENITINQGEKLVLKCLINSNPLCQQIRWLHNERELIIQSCTTEKLAEYTIENIDRFHAGKYTCEVKNRLNTSFDGISHVSTDVRVQYPPYILNSYKKLSVLENYDVRSECLADAYPKAELIWFGPSGQRLTSFTEERSFNETVLSSELHLPASYSSTLGLYRCVAKNQFGQAEFVIEFQRPGLPDPPIQLEAVNITQSSFVLNWQSGYDGGFEQIFHIILHSNHTEERYTNLNTIRFEDLNEKTEYLIKIRSKNEIGFSNSSTNLIILTKESSFQSEDFPLIEQAYYTFDNRRIHFQLSSIRSRLISFDQLCIQYYNTEEISSCIPIQLLNNELDINFEQRNLRLKLCLINQTDICSKSISIPTDLPFTKNFSEWIFILTGGILGLCVVCGLIGLFICIRQQKHKCKNGSTDTLKSNSDHFHSIPSVRVSDTNSCLYYPTNQTRTLCYNDETTGIYSIQEKKNSICFDSGMPSTTSNNSDSVASQALSSSDFYDRSDGEYLVNGRVPTYISNIGRENQLNIPIHGRISSEEESGFSTPTKSHLGKKLVYEVIV